MLDVIPPFAYKGKTVSARIPPGRAGMPRPMLWIASINNLKFEGFPAIPGETEAEVKARVLERVDAVLDGRA
jgi:hypothetical protein